MNPQPAAPGTHILRDFRSAERPDAPPHHARNWRFRPTVFQCLDHVVAGRHSQNTSLGIDDRKLVVRSAQESFRGVSNPGVWARYGTATMTSSNDLSGMRCIRATP